MRSRGSSGSTDRARFVQANVYDARHMLPDPEGFDVVYTTWGTIGWLPDVAEWARIIAWFLKPGGRLYFADGHPAAWALDDPADGAADPRPALRYEYFGEGRPDIWDEAGDYADDQAVVENTVTWEWAHPTAEVLTALARRGTATRLLPRASGGAVAHVPTPGGCGRRALGMAGRAVAAAHVLPRRDPVAMTAPTPC